MPLFTAAKASSSAHAAPQRAFIVPGMFTDTELSTAQLIQQRRLQMLVHSRIYYELDTNIISDHQWAKLATELAQLQQQYPEIAARVCYAEAFQDWDGSTGAFLPLKDEWVVRKADQLLHLHTREGNHVEYKEVQQSTGESSGKSHERKSDSKQRSNSVPERRRLF